MRTALLLIFTLLTAPAFRAAAPATPCVTPTDACAGWVVFGGGPARTMVYTSYPLATLNDAIRRAVIMLHGTNATLTTTQHSGGGSVSRARSTTRLPLRRNPSPATSATDEVSGGGDSWRSGGMPPSRSELRRSTADELSSRERTFPNMKHRRTGHSAGVQDVTATRWRTSTDTRRARDLRRGQSIDYAWPDAVRPVARAMEPRRRRWLESHAGHGGTTHTMDPTMRLPTSAPTTTAGRSVWKPHGHTAKMTDDQLKKQLVSRPTTFLWTSRYAALED
jgi:hypothetical protein